ncbi:MAG: hypothetical protein K2K86_07145 [Muribaculaceae bacterium]|nr:hypothetical protein [Muribaculaceae bacterium]
MATKPYKKSVLDRPGHPDGMRVPENYFESFARDMISRLPENELEKQPARLLTPPTRWQRLRPFVYMAAMFAGIWCMMNMFSMIQKNASSFNDTSLIATTTPAHDDYIIDYVIDDYNGDQLLDELYAEGFSPNDFNF